MNDAAAQLHLAAALSDKAKSKADISENGIENCVRASSSCDKTLKYSANPLSVAAPGNAMQRP
jgi:hypothetical protein